MVAHVQHLAACGTAAVQYGTARQGTAVSNTVAARPRQGQEDTCASSLRRTLCDPERLQQAAVRWRGPSPSPTPTPAARARAAALCLPCAALPCPCRCPCPRDPPSVTPSILCRSRYHPPWYTMLPLARLEGPPAPPALSRAMSCAVVGGCVWLIGDRYSN